jgi:hypothetical protein
VTSSRQRIFQFSAVSILAVTMVFLVSCSKPDDSSQFTAVYQTLNSNNCIGCHSSTGAATAAGVQLDFSSQALAYATLTTKTVTGTSSSGICAGVPIIVAGNASSSYLVAVLIASAAHTNFYKSGCTPYNGHLSDTNISPADQQAIMNWIQNGAKQ